MITNRKPFILIILDGWGISSEQQGNAIALAKTPNLDKLGAEYPNTRLSCSGEAVGLPKGVMGNSEVGHLNIGAGRIVYQDLLRIDMAIQDKAFSRSDVLKSVMLNVNTYDSALHLMGLVSDGGVHSQLNHLFALLDMAKERGVKKVYVHAILDGRDTPPDSGIRYISQLQEHIQTNHFGRIVTLCGRFYAMDRDNRWERIEKAYRLYTRGEGIKEADPESAIRHAYESGETDEFIQPVLIRDDADHCPGIIKENDGVIFFNFRADRAREITRALTDPNFDLFERGKLPLLCGYICMTQYDESFTLPVAFPPVHLDQILGQVISRQGLCQLRIAETEKYAHVTYFFNGGEEKPFPREDRCLIPSPREVRTYDLKPEMSAIQVANEVISRLESKAYDLIVLNFANMDMVGHTGVLDAAVKACETVDECVGRVVSHVRAQGGIAIITADHGNAEQMQQENSHNPHTAHTLNPVPLILVDDAKKNAGLRSDGKLGDIAPTILHLMGIGQPDQMTGMSLIDKA